MKLNQDLKKTVVKWLKERTRETWDQRYVNDLKMVVAILQEIPDEKKREDLFNLTVARTLNDQSCTTLVNFRNLLKHYARYAIAKYFNKKFP